MPLQRRLPKFGFKNINRVEYKVVNLDALEALAAAKGLEKIGLEELRAAGLVGKKDLVKVLGNETQPVHEVSDRPDSAGPGTRLSFQPAFAGCECRRFCRDGLVDGSVLDHHPGCRLHVHNVAWRAYHRPWYR